MRMKLEEYRKKSTSNRWTKERNPKADVNFKTVKDRQMDATGVHTGGHKRSSGNVICNPKSRFKRLMVSCLSKCQEVMDVMVCTVVNTSPRLDH